MIGPITVEMLSGEGPLPALPYQTVVMGLQESRDVALKARAKAIVAARAKEAAARSRIRSLKVWAENVDAAVLAHFDPIRYGGEDGRERLMVELNDIEESLPSVDNSERPRGGTFPLTWPAPWVNEYKELMERVKQFSSSGAGAAMDTAPAAAPAAPVRERVRVPVMKAARSAAGETSGSAARAPARRTKSPRNGQFFLYPTTYEPFVCVGKVVPSPDPVSPHRKVAFQQYEFPSESRAIGEARKLAKTGTPSPKWLNRPLTPIATSRLVHCEEHRIGPEVKLTGTNVLNAASKRALIAQVANRK